MWQAVVDMAQVAKLSNAYTMIAAPNVRERRIPPDVTAKGWRASVKARKKEAARKRSAILRLIRAGSKNSFQVAEALGISQAYASKILLELTKTGKVVALTGYKRMTYQATKWR